MLKTHEYDAPDGGGPCRHPRGDGDIPCGYNADHRIHNRDATEATTRTARSGDGRREPVRIDGRRRRRGLPWAELPVSGKIAVMIMVAGCGAVFVSACVALSWAMLRMGGVIG